MNKVFQKINRDLFEDYIFTQIIEKKYEYEESTLVQEQQIVWLNPEDYHHLLAYLVKNSPISYSSTSTEIDVCGITVVCDQFDDVPVEKRSLFPKSSHYSDKSLYRDFYTGVSFNPTGSTLSGTINTCPPGSIRDYELVFNYGT